MPSSSSSLLLSITAQKLARETERADAAEHKGLQLAAQLRKLSDQKSSLQLMLDKSHHELELFKVQLDLANQGCLLRIHMLLSLIYPTEVRKAEETVMRIDRARLRAEEQAARERAKVRQLMEKIAIDDALHQGREIGFREGLERGKMLGWAELMTRRGLDDRETGRQSRQSISRPSSASSNPARRGSTPRWAAKITILCNDVLTKQDRKIQTLILCQCDRLAESRTQALLFLFACGPLP